MEPSSEDLDRELGELLKAEAWRERQRQPFYTESVKGEFTKLDGLLAEHCDTAAIFAIDETAELLLIENPSIEEIDEYQQNIVAFVDELIQSDIEGSPEVIQGELLVSGEGQVYFYDSGDDHEIHEEIAELGIGEKIIGDIVGYRVDSFIDEEKFLPRILLYVELENAVESSSDARLGTVFVPIQPEKYKYGKVIRTNSAEARFNSSEPETTLVDAATHFKSEITIEVINDIENDLNHNEYEDHHLIRVEAREQLLSLLEHIDAEQVFTLSASKAINLAHEEQALVEAPVNFIDIVLLEQSDGWRAHYVFEQIVKGNTECWHVTHDAITSIRSSLES